MSGSCGWNHALIEKGLRPILPSGLGSIDRWNHALIEKGLRLWRSLDYIVHAPRWNHALIEKGLRRVLSFRKIRQVMALESCPD